MPEEKKRIRNLTTYAVIMLLSVLIIIVIAAMADSREETFENRINETEQANMNISNEIVKLKDDNYVLTKEKEKLTEELENQKGQTAFYQKIAEIWSQIMAEEFKQAEETFKTIETEGLSEEQQSCYKTLATFFKNN